MSGTQQVPCLHVDWSFVAGPGVVTHVVCHHCGSYIGGPTLEDVRREWERWLDYVANGPVWMVTVS